ncbi:sensor histidine kinase [Tissierellaceae bacterium HCP3S3_D8]
MNFFNRLSFKHRILLGNFLVGMLPTLILILCFMQIFVISLERHDRERAFKQINELDTSFENYLEDHKDVIESIASNDLIQEALMATDHENENEIYVELYQATEGMRKGVSVSIYDEKGRMYWGTLGTKEGVNLPTRWGVLRKASQSSGMILYSEGLNGRIGNKTLLWLANAIRDGKGNIIGYVVTEITSIGFQDLFNSFVINGESVMIVDNFGYSIYSSDNVYLPHNISRQMIDDFRQEGKLSMIKRENNFSFLQRNEDYGYYIFLTIPAGMTNEAIDLMELIGLLGLGIALSFSGFVSFLLSKGLTRPINELKQAIERVEKGHLDTRIATSRKDEFGELSDSFDRMNENLQRYTQQLVERQREISEIRIRLLQAQLNPHFLYNSLDTIKWLAKMNEVSGVADITNDLAQILRCSISNDQFITVREELDVVESYIEIQKIRFSDRFKHSFSVPEDLLDIKIPKLILQPLVENSIIHGLQDKEGGQISITGKLYQGDLLLTIRDNGCGMPADMVNEYNLGNFHKDGGHLGIYNVYYILKLYYGQNYGIHIISKPGNGTEVNIIFPVERGVVNHEKSFNC